MAGSSRQSLPSWITAAAATTTTTRVDIEGINKEGGPKNEESKSVPSASDFDLGFVERAFAAAGAAVLSAVIVNPLDVAKTRLQAQAAGVPYQGLCGTASFESNTMFPCVKSSSHAVPGSQQLCASECNRYKGALDVFNKVIRQEGIGRLWRGTNASLALAVPTVGIYMPCYDIFRNSMEEFTIQNCPALTPYVPLVAGAVARSISCITCYPVELARTRMQAFKETQAGVKPSGVWKTLIEVINPVGGTNNTQKLTVQSYRILWTGLGAQLARDVPFSAICWATLEPIRRQILALMGDEAGASRVLGANFSAGFVAGTLAAAATCPFDVAKTRRQIEKDPTRALNMTTTRTLLEIWRDGGVKGLFTGVGPRVARAGPSVGIVVSFYEVVKYTLHHRYHQFTK
ncbi:mitochondrial carrier protein MTM1 isoform X1 [Populus trichocarpa]|uniref:mitochondrial carrier protein MTM1 isoform X1 n=1 Tax=Populus trichocarpa TaxID=3694 RepID=UPI002277A7A1|nr:mitochondrial carrier protein MTM1 isoform X1 [Populus trichocarpa]XP_024451833.2 mitochondrial carrier protein MTM1 isoform X1 [Populus trichocarpa]XP_052306381.1 mitochondrial carrier protein MTM1 isoform X1 [Populus trichocarpa]